jgi:DNA mismatch repair protein MutS
MVQRVSLSSFSLLWPSPQERERRRARLSPTTCGDLDLAAVVRALAGRDRRREEFAWSVLTDVGTGPDVIRYRQDVLDDLRRDSRLAARLGAVLPTLAELGRGGEPPASQREDDWGILKLTRRLADLALYVRAVADLRGALAEAEPRSAGLRSLAAELAAEAASPEFAALEQELPEMRERVRQGESITIAINLKPSWEPESAAILSIGPHVPGPASLVDRLFHGHQPAEARALTPLRRAEPVQLTNPDNALFRDLRTLLEATAGPAVTALERYRALSAAKLAHLEPEIAFYLQAAALAARLAEAGLPLCRPEIAPPAERSTHVASGYNLALALRLMEARGAGPQRIVPSDIVFDGEGGRVWILTGPNRGGKTTFIRAVGLAHVLFSAGLPVPGRAARISPVDMIHTHFLAPETAKPGEGRLDEEAERLAEIFSEATPHSLLLLNEVLAGTSQVEALALAVDAVRGLRLLGARCIYATHLHDLAAAADRINESVPGADSPVASLVAGIQEGDADPGPEPIEIRRRGDPEGAAGEEAVPDPADRGEGEIRPTFHIVPGPPRMQSFASAIAQQHGISFGQLRERLRERGIVPR